MMSFLDLVVVAGMFFLRIGVPLLVMAGLVYGLTRLDRRWEAEARASRQAEAAKQPAVQPGTRPQAPKPGTVIRVPAPQPQVPWVPPPAVGKLPTQPGLMAAPAPQSCWEAKGCSDAKRAECAAPQHPGVLCWQARFNAEGAIPEDCVECDQFQRYLKM
jgi:hypothetical protein